ncbi:MAG: xanthine dehydrogenase family protein subunit M [Pseudomonadota bacterium]
MLLPQFECHLPSSLEEACLLLKKHRDKAKVLAGGTDLLVNMKRKILSPPHLVALDRTSGLADIALCGEVLEIGALATASALASSPTVLQTVPVLALGAGKIGSPLIRNRATVGGNLVSARPAGDTAPPLMALGAVVVLQSAAGVRETSLDEFFLGPGQTIMTPEEILIGIRIPVPGPGTGGGYEKLGLRAALEIAIVNVAAVIKLNSTGKKIDSARVVLGAVAPRPIRSPRAEEALIGKPAGPKALEKAAAAAVEDARPISDHRGSAEYRRLMVEVLTRRALVSALENARQSLGG